MTDADRLAKARRDQAAERNRQAAASVATAAAQARSESLRAINQLVPKVLAALARNGYPDSELVRVKKLIGSTERAGWVIAYRQDWLRDGYVRATCYLLSTGDFVNQSHSTPLRGGTPCRASEAGYEPQAIEQGLRTLLEKYGG
jgi:hypothetical protein